MARSLSLSAYMALVRRTPGVALPITVPRPEGELIWAHADNPARVPALLQMIARLAPLRQDVHLLLTTPPEVTVPETPGQHVFRQPVPEETMPAINRFLEHWSPDLCIWSGGHLRPALISAAAEKKIPLFLVDADEEGFDEVRWRWLPNMARRVIGHFSVVYAASANAATRLRRLGVPQEDITLTGPLQDGGIVLSYDPTDREELSRTLTGRPIWLAAMFTRGELETILKAHRSASRAAHRLLLILAPDTTTDLSEIHAALTAEGWRVALWSEGQFPDESTQILLADTVGEMGLWYHLSPLTFLGNSLAAGSRGHDPFAAAGFGSAIIHGPCVGAHQTAYSRLATAGAARVVRDSETFAAAISRLIAPDQSAAMALAAWKVVSQGAEVTDRVMELIQDALDRRGGH